MAEIRVRMQCSEYGLPDAVIAVGWDALMNYKPDPDFKNYRFSIKNEVQISCNALPKNEWDVDEPENPWASFLIMDNGCYRFQIAVDLYCDGAWSEFWVGEFTTTEWRINRDDKYVIVKPKVSEFSFADWGIECIKKKWTDVINIYDIPEQIEVKPYTDQYDIFEYQADYTMPCSEVTPPDVPDFCFDEVVETQMPVFSTCTFFYHRLVKAGTCEGGSPVPPDLVSDWYLFDGSCPGTPLYWKCPADSHLAATYQYGRLFGDVMQYLLDQSGCGLQVQSDFFNINPQGDAPDNRAYQAALLYLQNLVLFQKSDIKRFDATNKSAKPVWVIKIKEVLDDLWVMFKVKASISDDVNLRLEHISFYEAQEGNDYTNEYYTKELQRDNSDNPRLTRFYFRDEQCSDYFKGLPIEIYCGEGEVDARCTVFYTDLAFATDADNAESVGDAGWFLMATEQVDGVYRVIQDNRPLSFTELHANYHTFDMAGVGKINGEEVEPDSIRKTRKQPAFKVKKCCTDTFRPDDYIITSLGNGEIDNADLNLETSELEITAKY